MTSILVLTATVLVGFRTMLYGIWTLKQRNIIGGIFVLLLSALSVFVAARYYFIM